MMDPLDFENRPLLERLSRKRALTAFILYLENCSGAFWRILSWLAFFAGLWLLQLPAVIGKFGPALTFFIFAGGLLYLLKQDLKNLRWPSKRAIDRRLEQESALHHRPLSALEDKLVNPRIAPTRKLWKRNQEQALTTLNRLRLPRPRPTVSKRDPVALRGFAVLTLIIGLVAAGNQWQDRISYGLFPFSFEAQEQTVSNLTLWITPPEYTGMEQITLQGKGRREEALDIAAGSTLKVRVNDGFTQPVLVMGENEMTLGKIGDKSWGLETEILPGKRLQLKQWPLTRADIAYNYIEDAPPIITVTDKPQQLPKGELRIPLTVLDDYGVADLTMRMDIDPMIIDRPMGTPYEETRAVMSPPGIELEMAPVYDLSWHPWSGLPVVIELEGVDHLGQRNEIEPLKLTLPERPFSHPVAQQLIEMRKRLIWTPESAAKNVAYDLNDILAKPESFQNDIIVTLALRTASSRLAYDQSPQGVARVVELLWDTALRIEEGDLTLAARNMRDAQRHLEQLLNNPDASDEEIAEAVQELREAMAKYMQEMYREMQKRMAKGDQLKQLPPEMFQNMISTEDMASFLAELEAEALSGNEDAARKLLSQLQQFMDMFDPSMDMTMPPQMEFMMEGINELQELIEKQQALLEQSQQQAEKMKGAQQIYPDFLPFDENILEQWGMGKMPPPPQDNPLKEQPAPDIDTQENKVEQDALRYILGQLMLETDEQLGEIPKNMQDAEQEMRASGTHLGKNRPDLSIPNQELAIKHLQQAMDDMSQQMQQMMQQMTIMSFGGANRMDPLGRPLQDGEGNSMFPGSRVKIPDEAERKRVQEILKTLRKRSGEIHRPDYELEYYRRLMKQF